MFEYAIRSKPAAPGKNRRRLLKEPRQSVPLGKIVTFVEPGLRSLLSVAAGENFPSSHAETFEGLVRALNDQEAYALLLSPGAVETARMQDLALLLARHPGVYPIAVVHRTARNIGERTLALGQCGVAKLVELDATGGCEALRASLAEGGGVLTRRISITLQPHLTNASSGSRKFFDVMIRTAPKYSTVGELALFFALKPSTLLSRFYRAGVPSPKMYLARMRLLYASAYFEVPALSIANVAYRLQFSSPQSFCRSIRTLAGVTASDFRETGFNTAVQKYAKELIEPYAMILAQFDPFM